MRDDEFEWDDRKAARNFARHGVRFEMARQAFSDDFSFARDDDREDYGEERYNLLGLVNGYVLHVTFTYRGDRIRIISARGAEPHEQRRYQKENR